MRVCVLTVALLGGLVAGCSNHSGDATATGGSASLASNIHSTFATGSAHRGPRIASAPDRGNLMDYAMTGQALRRGASVWHPVQVSEAFALHAIATGGMVIDGPIGQPIRLAYKRHVEHADGNWTWVGRTTDGQEAVLTFGPDAVFGSIPNGKDAPLQLTTARGQNWLVESDQSKIADGAENGGPDMLVANGLPHLPGERPTWQPAAAAPATMTQAAAQPSIQSAAAPTASASPATASATATPTPTVDVLLGYTKGFADRLGGTSQAVTRLNFIVDVANQAYADSQVTGRIHVVKMLQVNYPDATDNQTALFELTGVNCVADNSGAHKVPEGGFDCTIAKTPAALQPLLAAREQYGADLVSLVRNYSSPENGSCGDAWLIGGGQAPINYAGAAYGFSVVSDTDGNTYPDGGNACRQEYLAHELGHNMGLQHDRATAGGTDDTNGDGKLLDPEEFGAYPYSFGYNTDSTAGNFYTIMSLRTAAQTGYRVFSNPRITTCGGFACGVVDKNDNARALGLTMPIVATFRYPSTANTPRVLLKQIDTNGNGTSDLLLRSHSLGQVVTWFMSGTTRTAASSFALSGSYTLVGTGDFNGDHRTDLLWTSAAHDLLISLSTGTGYSTAAAPYTYSSGTQVIGAADVNGNGTADILLRNAAAGRVYVWFMSGRTRVAAGSAVVGASYDFVGSGDLNHDGRQDLVWTSANRDVLVSTSTGGSFTSALIGLNYSSSYDLAGLTDVNGDGSADLLLRSRPLGKLVTWFMNGNTRTAASGTTVSGAYQLVGKGDFNGDHLGDLLWTDGTGKILMTFSTGSNFTDNPLTYVFSTSYKLMDAN